MKMAKLRYFLTTENFGFMNLRQSFGCDLMAKKPSCESGTITTILNMHVSPQSHTSHIRLYFNFINFKYFLRLSNQLAATELL